ncbi:tyrosine-type recombinase/integrase [Proteocatella sphenisci]|uniref:tyrosine-type recombinase/integrase n=1 Tax=Proteocatella sphenisci TaxID=181070 RepID=UPI000A015691|nr:tyrosine-type recombinase/integrase [Proteocatella sphenisci]
MGFDRQDDEDHLNLVFPSSTFNFRTTANLRRRFMLVCNAAGIEYINLHALRHTFATRMLEKDLMPKVVSQML